MSDSNSTFVLDWQHIALIALAIAGGVLCAFKPSVAPMIGPLVSTIVPIALAKKSPVTIASSQSPSSTTNEEAGPTVINIGTIPSHVTVSEEGDLKISWDKTREKT